MTTQGNPLHIAARRGDLDTVRQLIDKGTDYNVRDDDGMAPLHVAAERGYFTIVDYLVSKGAAINIRNKKGQTPLHLAAKKGRFEKVLGYLIDKGAGINIKDNKGLTPLHIAVEELRVMTAKFLVNKGANVNSKDNDGMTPLHVAAKKGECIEIVIKLKDKGADINIKDNNGQTPLHTAAKVGNEYTMREFVDLGANMNIKDNDGISFYVRHINIKDKDGMTPLHLAAKIGHVQIVNYLCVEGADINIQDNNAMTPLHLAVESNHIEMVECLLDQRADINVQDDNERTPLHVAASKGRDYTVECLVKKGANMNIKDKNGMTPLHLVGSGHIKIVTYLCDKGADLNIQDNDGQTPLHVAASNGRDYTVEWLVKKGADMNIKDKKGMTPLHLAVESNHIKMVECFLDQGADINVQDDNEQTPLHVAASNGRDYTVECLVKEGADVNIRDKKGQTPLHVAASSGHDYTVECLVMKGANMDIKDKNGMTALHLAAEGGHIKIVTHLGDKGADINIQDNDGQTPLHVAASNGRDYTVECLVRKGADMNIKDKKGMTPLHLAVESNHIKMVECLLDQGADINVQDDNEQTPLHVAASKGRDHTVEYLVKKEADMNIKDKRGQTPLHVAASRGRDYTVECLVKKGADNNIKDKAGMTPMEVAAERGHMDIVHYLRGDSNSDDVCYTSSPETSQITEEKAVYPPRITQHPENQSVCIGVNIEFSIGATGDNLHFQWQKDGSDLVNTGKYHGVFTDTLHIVAVEGSDEGDYRCLVENNVGKLFSDEALLSFDDYYLSVCEQAMRESGKTDQTIMHCLFVGPPGVGKSTLLKRLLRMKLDPIRTSTLLAEKSVRVGIRDVSTYVAQVCDFDWQIMEDPMMQASELIEQLSTQSKKISTKGNDLATEGPNQQVFDHTEQVFEQERIPNSPLNTSVVAEELRRNNTFVREGLDESNTFTKEESIKSNTPAEKANKSQISKSAAEESGHTSKPKVFQVSKTMDYFRCVLKEKGVSRVHIDNPCTLYLTDSGGQPEFQELLPALVVGPCVFFVVFPLHKDLNTKYEVEYERPNEKKQIQKYTSSLTIKEDLMRSLASIASIEYKDIYGKQVQPRVMFVATFKDKVSKEDGQRRLEILQALIEKTDAYRQGMIVYASKIQMVFTINNASDDEAKKDTMVICGAIQNLTRFFKVSTPSPWLIFGILIQHLVKDSVIHKKECIKIAQECGIHSDVFEAALQFLHKQTGLLQYYKKPSELSHIVIRHPQHLFSRVSQLVEKTFTFEDTQGTQCPEDFKKGIFKNADYKELTKHCSSSLLTPSMLLDLLVHLNVVLPLSDGEKYFMPCAITHIDRASSGHSTQSATIPPLLITFKNGYCPKGLFGSLVAYIVNRQVANCKLSLDESEIHRDQICFRLGLHRLLLRINPTYIYIEVIPYRPDTSLSTELCTLCNEVRKFIEDNITEACKTLYYSNSANYGLSFICQCREKDIFHLAELKDSVNGHLFLCTRSKKEALVNPNCHIWLPEPNISEHPESQLVSPGTKAVFRLKATGDNLQFHWQKDCSDIDDHGTRYRGTHTNKLHILKVEKGDSGNYRCRVSNNLEEKLSDEAVLTVTERPNLPKLLRFPSKEGTINVPKQISTNYLTFGILLLNDETGAEVNRIVLKHHEDAEQINLEILRLWIEGKGKPLSWDALIDVLRATGLDILAGDIKDNLQH